MTYKNVPADKITLKMKSSLVLTLEKVQHHTLAVETLQLSLYETLLYIIRFSF